MQNARLRLKVIKDAPVETGAMAARLHVLGMSMLPFSLYLRIELPEQEAAEAPLFLHLLGRPASDKPNALFLTARLPEQEQQPGEVRGAGRRLLLMLGGDEIPNGRYRLALVRNRQHIAFADLAKRADQLRLLTPDTADPAPDPAPLLISGTHKSGTTWLEKVIDAHPDCMVLHEANTFNLMDVGELRRMMTARAQSFRNKNYIRWLDPAFDPADFSRFLQISLARDVTLRLGRAWGARFVADRTPGYCSLYPHLPRFWEELRIIHIVRHPLDVLTSRLFHEANLERNPSADAQVARPLLESINKKLDAGGDLAAGEILSDEDLASPAITSLLQDWRRDQDHYAFARETPNIRLHLVQYERLVADFRAEAGRLFAFIGADPQRTDLASIQLRTSFEALSGGRTAGQADPRSFFRKGVAGDWRNVLSPAQAALLWQPVAATAQALGYTLESTLAPVPRQAARRR